MVRSRLITLALFVGTLAATTVIGQTPPATDGPKFDKGYPKRYPAPTGWWVQAKGGLDTTKYPQGKITGDLAFMAVWEIDKDGKEIAGTKRTFKGQADPATNSWTVLTSKAYDPKTGKEEVFPGYPPGNYKVKVEVKLKETPTSTERSGFVEATLEIKRDMEPPPDGGEAIARPRQRPWFIPDRRGSYAEGRG
jgi:hypothetical protein